MIQRLILTDHRHDDMDSDSDSSFSFNYAESSHDSQTESTTIQLGSIPPRIANLQKYKKTQYSNLSRGTYAPSGKPSPSPWNSFHND
jgi:hypothetical protein